MHGKPLLYEMPPTPFSEGHSRELKGFHGCRLCLLKVSFSRDDLPLWSTARSRWMWTNRRWAMTPVWCFNCRLHKHCKFARVVFLWWSKITQVGKSSPHGAQTVLIAGLNITRWHSTLICRWQLLEHEVEWLPGLNRDPVKVTQHCNHSTGGPGRSSEAALLLKASTWEPGINERQINKTVD